MRKPFVATCADSLERAYAGGCRHHSARLCPGSQSRWKRVRHELAAPFTVLCAVSATPPCPDRPGNSTYNINSQSPGQLRIYTLFGSLLGTSAQASNNARNMSCSP